MKQIFFICFIATLFFSSCTKVINIDLNSAEPRIIIEANMSDQPASAMVKLSKTVNYDESNTFPPVKGASVMINDNYGNAYTLNESSPGIYTLPSLQGVPGRAYTIIVDANGKSYSATSTMPNPVSIDTLMQEISNGGPFGGGDSNIVVKAQFSDPANISNYYRFIEIINDTIIDKIVIEDDEFRDGEQISTSLPQKDPKLYPGDSVSVMLESIDKNVFNYFTQLKRLSGNGQPTNTPANPVSNFNNGALGYFSAQAVITKYIIIQ